jgi:Ca2+-binding RTX toxin-like protein
MRKSVLLLATMALAVLLASGLALAAPKGGNTITEIDCNLVGSTSCQGTSGPDIIYGTPSADVIVPYAGNDTVYAGSGADEVRHSFGNDLIKGGYGTDTLRGGFDNDEIYGGPDKDLIDCAYVKPRGKGEAWDTAYAYANDTVVDCLPPIREDWTAYTADPSDPTDPRNP